MNIREIETNLNLTIPKFKCDSILSDDIPQPLPNQSFYMVFVGPPRSGKTSIAVSLLSTKKSKKNNKKSIYRGVFDNIIVVAPKNSLKSLKKNIFENLDEDKIYNDLDYETLETIYDKILEYREEDDENNTLLYIDDMASSLKNAELLKFFNKIVSNRRHLRVSIMLITQYLNSIPLSNRRLISHIFLYKCNNKKEYSSIYEELIPTNKKEFEQICKYCFTDPHNFILIDCDKSIFHKKFNKLIF